MPDTHVERISWVRLVLLVVGRAYRAALLVLVVVALAPHALGWSAYAVRTGSMEPSIDVGDIVVAQPVSADAPPALGRVMVFVNPASDDRQLLVHRIVAKLDDGTYTTAGDANPLPDSTPVSRDGFEARAVLLAPYAGLPLTWLQQGNLLAASLWLGLTIAAFILAIDPKRSRRRRVRRAPLAIAGAVGVTLTLVLAATAAAATFTGATVNGSNSWTVGQFSQPYLSAVLADRPYLVHLLDEEPGTWAADSSGNSRTGRFTGIAGYRTPGALPKNPGYAVNLGTAGRVVTDGTAVGGPDTFTVEAWFKTTTTRGGPLMGFENSRDARSGVADRQLAMRADGKLVYGAWLAPSIKTITSPRAYNDGSWHHAVLVAENKGSQQVATLYVDGQQVATGASSRTGHFTGWWRIGAGTLTASGLGVAAGFDGHVDNAAVYHSPLSGARVAAHYAAR